MPIKGRSSRRLVTVLLLFLITLTNVLLTLRNSNVSIQGYNTKNLALNNSTAQEKSDKTSITGSRTNVRSHVHVLYGLSGNAAGFIEEFEISLKSVLLNSPLYGDLTVHVMADIPAYKALDAVWNRTGIREWTTANSISVQVYNVERLIPSWKKHIEDHIKVPVATSTGVHTVGCFFRLFAHKVMDTSVVEHVVYMDTDVVIMAPLDALWQHVNSSAAFQWGDTETSGFLVLNLSKMDHIWKLAKQLDLIAISKKLDQRPDDQLIFRSVYLKYPGEVSLLPPEWDCTLSAVWRGNLLDIRPSVGMLHFNGGGSSTENAFEHHSHISGENWKNTWGTAQYYPKLSWSWAKFIVESRVPRGGEGGPLVIHQNSEVIA